MPDHWQETTLGDAADIVSGGTPRTAEPEFWNGDIVWVTPTEVVAHEGKVITDSERKITPEGLSGSSAKLLPVDAVLLTSRATIGAVALAGVPLATNQGFASLVCGGGLLPHFAMYWCQLNTHEFLSRAGGNTFREISRKKVAAIPMDLPPIHEQRRIVDVVGSIDSYISALEDQLGATRAARAALLYDLLSHPGDDWVSNTLGEAAAWSSGKALPASRRHPDGRFPILGANGEIGRTDEYLIDVDVVLVGRVGAVGAIHLSRGAVWVSDNALIALPTSLLTLEYLEVLLTTFDFTPFVSGNAQPVVTQGRLKQQVVELPPLAEQRRIVDVVGSFDVQVEALVVQLGAARRLRSGVLSDLLSGERLLDESYDVVVGL